MSLCFFPLLAFDKSDNTIKYSLGRVLLGTQQDSGLRNEEESHNIMEGKSRNWGQGCTFNAGIQSIEVPWRGKRPKPHYPVSPEEELESLRQDPHPRSPNRKQGDGSRSICSLLNRSLSGFCQLQKLSLRGVLGIKVFYCWIAVGGIFLNAWKQEGIGSLMQGHQTELCVLANAI